MRTPPPFLSCSTLFSLLLLLSGCGGGGGGGGASGNPTPESQTSTLCVESEENILSSVQPLAQLSAQQSTSVPDSIAPLHTVQQQLRYAPNRLIVKLKATDTQATRLVGQAAFSPSYSAPYSAPLAQTQNDTNPATLAGFELQPLDAPHGRVSMGALNRASGLHTKQQTLQQTQSTGNTGLYTVHVGGNAQSLEAARDALLATGVVAYVEKDFELFLTSEQVTPQSTAPQHTSPTPASASGSEAQQQVVAVIDTGVYDQHPSLTAMMWLNPSEIAGNGLDDDGDGYVDNLHGADLVGSTGNSQPYEEASSKNHGTQVAGVVAQAAQSATSGSDKVKIMALKVQGSNGVIYTSDVIRAQSFIVQKKRAGTPIAVVNRSMGCYSCASQAMQQSIESLTQEGILVINSAGNDSRDTSTSNFYPSAYKLAGLITVGAHNRYGVLSTFSNYGNQVDIAALGEGIQTSSGTGGAAVVQGTSFSAPYVSGLAGVVKANSSGIGLAELKMRVLARGLDSSDRASCTLAGLVASNKYASVEASQAPASCTTNKPQIVAPSNYESAEASYWGDLQKLSPNIFTAGASHLLSAQIENCPGQTQGLQFTSSDGQTITARDDGVYPDKMAGDGLYNALYQAPKRPADNAEIKIQAEHLLQTGKVLSGTKTLRIADAGHYKTRLEAMAFNSIAATGTRLNFTVSAADLAQGPASNVQTPFPIYFSGLWQDAFYVSNTGRICFQYALAQHNKGLYCNNPPWEKDALPNGWRQVQGNTSYYQTIMGTIAPWWDSQWGHGNTGIYTKVEGMAPNRTFIVSWEGMKPSTTAQTSAGAAQFQVVFHEGQSYFHMVYGNTTLGNYGADNTANMDNGQSASVGVQHYTGKTGLTLSYRTVGSPNQDGIYSNRAYRYAFDMAPFSDVNAVQSSAITGISAAQFADTCESSRFCPDAPLKRQEAAAWLARMAWGHDLVASLSAPDRSQLDDVDNANPYFKHIHTMQSAGAMNQCANALFCPTAPASGAEFHTFLYRNAAPQSTPDVSATPTLTRAQAATLLERVSRPFDYH